MVKALKKLRLSSASLLETNFFLKKFHLLSQLQRLTLRMNMTNMNNETVHLLAQSLCSFSNLQSFKFLVYPAINDGPNQCDTISELFNPLWTEYINIDISKNSIFGFFHFFLVILLEKSALQRSFLELLRIFWR